MGVVDSYQGVGGAEGVNYLEVCIFYLCFCLLFCQILCLFFLRDLWMIAVVSVSVFITCFLCLQSL